VAQRGEFVVLGIHIVRTRAKEGEGDTVSSGWLGPIGVDLLYELGGVPRHAQARWRGRLDMGLVFGAVRDVQAEPAVERQRGLHVAGDDADEVES
jgi:hypothetical protein